MLQLLVEKKHQVEGFGVEALFLFGSFARGDETEKSDIDFLVKFKGSPTFDQYMDLKFFLEDLTGKKIDLVTDKGLRPELRDYVEEEWIRAA